MEEQHKLKNRLLVLLLEKGSREKRRITQSELANEIGVMPNTISKWVNQDMQRLDASLIVRLCEYFNCPVGDLLYLEPLEEEK